MTAIVVTPSPLAAALARERRRPQGVLHCGAFGVSSWRYPGDLSLLVAVLLTRGRVTRAQGLLLLAIWTGYVAVHL